MSSSPKTTRDPKVLAKLLGVAPRTLRWWRSQGLPQRKDGSWNLLAVKRWRADREKASAANRRRLSADGSFVRSMTRVDRAPPETTDDLDHTSTDGDDNRTEAAGVDFSTDVDSQLVAGRNPRAIIVEQEARRRFWLAEEQRIKSRKLAGELIEASGVVAEKVHLCTAFRRMFLDHCRRVAPLVLGLEDTLTAQQMLEREAETALARIQQMGGIATD